MKTKLMKLVTKLEQKMSSKYHPVNLLMLVEREGYSKFRLLISSDTLKSDLTTISFLSKELAKFLSKEEFKILSGVEVVDSRCDFFIETRDYLENNGNPDEFYNLELGGLKINRALVIISPVDNSKKYVQEAALRDLEKRFQDDVRQGLIQLEQLLASKYVTKDELKQWLIGKDNSSTRSSEQKQLPLIEKKNFSTWSLEQNQLPRPAPKALQNQNKTIYQKDSING